MDGDGRGPLEWAEPRAATNWQPRWLLEDTDGCVMGLARDDGCYVVLYAHGDQWRPGIHIPQVAARFIAELEAGGRPDYAPLQGGS